MLCGLLPATSGHVIIDGIDFKPAYTNDIKKRVGYMSQRFTLYNDLSVVENLDFAAALRGVAREIFDAAGSFAGFYRMESQFENGC